MAGPRTQQLKNVHQKEVLMHYIVDGGIVQGVQYGRVVIKQCCNYANINISNTESTGYSPAGGLVRKY